ncbi:hypothetical protein [Paraflavitalea sp. CAU 1676]|uniref:hypothetical protein n=1 Tax=Paraflavitalea sp. CAU 1676 TaxID=3032598 RepID=UPI0023DBBC7E|nr:hypothetical protein [Paraflavitalea sp. CAU 1676]MDF2192362.1 hypothetical protein [Paraflavitalea sp. CAU 1676]
MPKQIGLIKLKGSVDDLVFSKTQDGYMAQKKALFNADKLKNDPNYEQVRLNNLEFATGGNASRILREAFSNEIFKASDNRMISRLTQTMIAALQADAVNDYGYRQVQSGNMGLLDGFDFNLGVPLSSTVRVPFTATANRATGQVNVTVPALIPQERVAAPAGGVTHYRLFAAAAALDFSTGASFSFRLSTPNLPHDNNEGAVTTLALTLPAASTQPIVVILGVEFMKMVNNKVYPNTKKQNALQILAIDTPPASGG